VKTEQVIAGLAVQVYTPNPKKRDVHPIPVVLLHGMWVAGWCFQLWIEWFTTRDYKVYVINLPGHGGSIATKPLGKYSVDDFFLSVRDTLVAMGEKRLHFIGHSTGGLILQKLLEWQAKELQDPIITEAVLLMSAPPAFIRLRGKVLWTLLKLRYLLPILCCGLFKPTKEDAIRHVLNYGLEGHRTKIHRKFVDESGRAARDIVFWRCKVSGRTIRKSAVRILIVAGQQDALVTPEVQFQIFRKYKSPLTTFLMVKSGHMPMIGGAYTYDILKGIVSWLYA